MGYIKHNAIILTSWDEEAIKTAHETAQSLGLVISKIVSSGWNGYSSFMVAPDGSKEGWIESDIGDGQRKQFREWLRTQGYDDGSSSLEWCEIAYGSDDEKAEIVCDQWHNEVE